MKEPSIDDNDTLLPIGIDIYESQEFFELIIEYIDRVGEEIKELTEALSSKQWNCALSHLHKIRNAKSFGYPELSESAKNLEDLIRDQRFQEIDSTEFIILHEKMKNGKNELKKAESNLK